MAKSVGNYIGVTEPPDEIYGKTLSIPDAALAAWYELLLGTGACRPRCSARATPSAHLARALVARFHGAARRDRPPSGNRSTASTSRREAARGRSPTVHWPAPQPALCTCRRCWRPAFGISTSEARRALAQGGVKLDGQPVGDGSLDVPALDVDGKVLQLGKRRFARVRAE